MAKETDKTKGSPSKLEKKAEAVTGEIVKLARMAELCFIDMGRLLKQVQDEALWGVYKYETFQQYCDNLELPQKQPYKWVLGVVSIWEVLVEQNGIDKERLAKIGIAKCLRLVPLARKGEMTEDHLALAEMSDTTDRVLRDNVGHSGDQDSSINCPRCGVQIMGAKWVKPEDEAVKATQEKYEREDNPPELE